MYIDAMSRALEVLHNTQIIRLAEQDLGGELQSASPRILSAAQLALQTCMTSPEYTSGPFTGFKRVIAKNISDPNDKERFYNRVQSLNGRTLLMPLPNGTINRTLVRAVNPDRVMLTAYGAPAKLALSPAERTLLSAVDGFNDPTIGTHARGVRTEPGHVTLTSAAVLGAINPGTDLHKAVHTYEHSTGARGNILAASTQAPNYMGVALPTKEFTYDTWPQALELLWHPEERTVQAAAEEDAVARVQAAGFVALRERGLVGNAVQALGAMR